MERESCRGESTAIFQNSCLSGKWVSWKKGHTSFLIKSVLISNRLDLPLQSRQTSTQFEGKRRFEEWPSPFAALPAPAAHPGYWLLGWHPPDPNRWSRLGGKGQNPWAPCQSALGKWLPGLELTFTSGLFMQFRVTLFGSEMQFIPSLYWLWRQRVRLKLVQPLAALSLPGAPFSLCYSLCLAELMITGLVDG